MHRLQKLIQSLESTGYPIAYNEFEGNVSLPFIVYRIPGYETLPADDVVYHQSIDVDVELYLPSRFNPQWESALDTALKEYYFKSVLLPIKEEKMIMKLYEMRLM